MDNLTRIALVRHGQTEYNKKKIIQGQVDIPLNKTGMDQARKTARHFINEKIDLIISSPLRRAKKTAEIIAGEIKYQKEILIDNAFIERDFGCADEMPISLIIDKVHSGDVSGLEHSDILEKRLMDGLINVTENNINKNIIIVSHSHSIKAILKALDPGNYSYATNLTNCAITVLEYLNKSFKIVRANFNDYL